jgi:glycerol uptake facilitator-like aquaporin
MLAAHLMFDETLLQVSTKVRSGPSQWFSEWVACFGLVVTILLTLRTNRTAVPMAVGLYIAAAYWFTASTSFANPAVTVARALSNTFAGIRPLDVAPFIIAQLMGAIAALYVCQLLLGEASRQAAEGQRASGIGSHDHRDLSQPDVRHVPRHAGHDPAERRGTGDHRVSEVASDAPAASRQS